MAKVSGKKEVTSETRPQEAKAYGRYLHIAPTKIQDLMRLVRGKTVSEAETILNFSGRKGGVVALKVLRSAEANAGGGFEKDQWVVAEALVSKGPLYRRRVQPRARGSADFLRSPSSHITMVLRGKSKGNEQMKKEPVAKSTTKAAKEVKNGPQA